MDHEIVIHAWGDIVCPWCWLGKQRLAAGIKLSGKKVAVEYHAYQLRADAPSSPVESLAEHICDVQECAAEEAQAGFAKLSELGAEFGLNYQWDAVQPVNSFLAHQLVYAAKASGQTPEEAAQRGGEMVERLMQAYFSQGLNIADTETLLKIAEEFGLDRARTRDQLESGEFADDVRCDIRDAKTLDIKGVPFYVLGGRFGLAGSQTPEVFAESIKTAVAELEAIS